MARVRLFLIFGLVLLALGAVALFVVVGGDEGDSAVVTATTAPRVTLTPPELPGEEQLRAGDIEGAREAIAAHLKRNPDDLRARFLLALTYEREADEAGAVKAYQEIIKVDASNYEAYFRIGQLLRAQKKPAEALTAFTKALELNSEFTAARVSLAEMAAATGDKDKAIRLYFDVIDMRPLGTHLDEIRTALAQLLNDSGQVDNAVVQLQKALAENPENAEARRLLGRLRPSALPGVTSSTKPGSGSGTEATATPTTYPPSTSPTT